MVKSTHFGYQQLPEADKARRVAAVFDSVAGRYDLMNDLMSAGLHRLWKRALIERSGVRPGERVLDLAGGTGDLARSFAPRVGAQGAVRRVGAARDAPRHFRVDLFHLDQRRIGRIRLGEEHVHVPRHPPREGWMASFTAMPRLVDAPPRSFGTPPSS